MNEWLQKVISKAKELWAKWSTIQKVILFGIIAAVIVVIVAAAKLSSKPSTVRLFSSPVTRQEDLDKILTRIDQENVKAYVTADGYISVDDERIARRMRNTLIGEGLVPGNIDPWASYFERSWSTTDADQNVKRKVAIQNQLTKHIESLDDIQSADVNLVLPENELFTSMQNPVTVSVILRLKNNNSDFYTNRSKIMGLQNLIKSAVEGLSEENIYIGNSEGKKINNFADMTDFDKVDLTKKQQELIREQEMELRAKILNSLQNSISKDRCRDLNVFIDMDMSEKQSQKEIYTPIEVTPDNPDTSYSERETVNGIPISEQVVDKKYESTIYNPEGPAGVDGQNPPVYSDMSNAIGVSKENGKTVNYAVNSERRNEVIAPKIERKTVSVNLDGTWDFEYNPDTKEYVMENPYKRKRVYSPISAEELLSYEKIIKGAIGYNKSNGDEVYVTNIAYDRTDQFKDEDDRWLADQQRKKTIILILVAVAVVLIGFILFKIISRELERRRRLREEELLRQQQAAREAALWEAKDEGMEVTMSVEETRRMELQENAINMAKEHPEDVALLIRTWLMEE